MQTDLNTIKYLSKRNQKENNRFKEDVKSPKISDKKLDSTVHDFYSSICAQINCKNCANCCITISPILKHDDINRISRILKMKTGDFIDKYLYRDEDDDLVFKSAPCPFLKDNLCMIYDERPEDCKSYPHLDKKHIKSRLVNIMNNYPICPIVFNVVENLKTNIEHLY
ncbi:MAG: hypothetical protein ACD_79C01355G0003 [uncultured bacterium]|nr:MAG: hypothetical protein ACD_79C01355G0003 [uncultured bacterium]